MKQAPDGAARLAELQYLLRYGGMKEACPASGRCHALALQPHGRPWALDIQGHSHSR
jgi:hypothetical protein